MIDSPSAPTSAPPTALAARRAAVWALLAGCVVALTGCTAERSYISATTGGGTTRVAPPTAVPHVTPSELTKTWQYGYVRSFSVNGDHYQLVLDRAYYCQGIAEDEPQCGTRPTGVPTGVPWIINNTSRTVTLTVPPRALIQLWSSGSRTTRVSHWLPDAFEPEHQRLRSVVYHAGTPMPAFLYADSAGEIVRIKED